MATEQQKTKLQLALERVQYPPPDPDKPYLYWDGEHLHFVDRATFEAPKEHAEYLKSLESVKHD
jgi:hypothetical protein